MPLHQLRCIVIEGMLKTRRCPRDARYVLSALPPSQLLSSALAESGKPRLRFSRALGEIAHASLIFSIAASKFGALLQP